MEQDGLLKSVQTVKTEVVELTTKDGRSVESSRILLQTITYMPVAIDSKELTSTGTVSVAQTLIYTCDSEGRGTGDKLSRFGGGDRNRTDE